MLGPARSMTAWRIDAERDWATASTEGTIMYRAMKMSSVWHVIAFDDMEKEAEAIEQLVLSGDVVILVDDLTELRSFVGTDVEMKLVDRDADPE